MGLSSLSYNLVTLARSHHRCPTICDCLNLIEFRTRPIIITQLSLMNSVAYKSAWSIPVSLGSVLALVHIYSYKIWLLHSRIELLFLLLTILLIQIELSDRDYELVQTFGVLHNLSRGWGHSGLGSHHVFDWYQAWFSWSWWILALLWELLRPVAGRLIRNLKLWCGSYSRTQTRLFVRKWRHVMSDNGRSILNLTFAS